MTSSSDILSGKVGTRERDEVGIESCEARKRIDVTELAECLSSVVRIYSLVILTSGCQGERWIGGHERRSIL